MRRFMLNKNSNKKGSTLLTVVVVSCFAAILIAAVLGFVQRAHKNAFINYNSEQAYYIATSALDSIHDYLEKDGADYTTLLDMAGANGGAGSKGTIKLGDNTIDDIIPGGECTLNVSYMGTAYIKVAVTGKCNGQEKTINAYYSVVKNSVPAQIDNAIYADANITFEFSSANAGSVTSKGDYNTSNNSTSNGSIVTDGDFNVKTSYNWTDDPDGCGSFIVVGGNFIANNSGAKFSPIFPKVLEQNVSEFISVKNGFMPIQSVTIGTPSKVMDLYCNTAYIGGANSSHTHWKNGYPSPNSMKLELYGNMYCYKIENTADPNYGHVDDGDLIVTNDASEFVITGDVYVEGDIRSGTNRDNRILGTLYISDTTNITTMNNHAIVCDAISYSTNTPMKVLDLIKTNKIKIPKVKGGYDYYSAAEFETLINSNNEADKVRVSEIVKTDPIVHTVSNSRNYKPSTDYKDYKREYQTTEEFVKDSATIKNLYQNALVTTTNKIANFETKFKDEYTGIEFEYVVDKNYCLIDYNQIYGLNGKDLLIDMTQFSGDCVIVIDTNNQVRSLENVNIIVKNQIKNADGTVTTEADGFCYIVLAYDDSESTSSTLNLHKVNIYDYCTYKHVIKDGKAINLSSYVGGDDKIINEIYTDKVYTPNLGRTYLMINEGDSLKLPQATHEHMLEAVVYAPGVLIEGTSCGNSTLKYLFDAENPDTVAKFSGDKRVAVLGAVICDSYKEDSNTFGIAFSAPAPGSGVGTSGSANKTKITFSHYESR